MSGPWEDFAPVSAEGPWRDFKPTAPAINFDQPAEAVRAEIAKLPEDQRKSALDAWAKAYVAKERSGTGKNDNLGVSLAGPLGYLADVVRNPTRINDTVRSFAKGTLIGTFADELNAATSDVAHKVSGGTVGAPYDEAVAYQRELDRAIARERPVETAVTQLAGGFAGPGTIAKRVAEGATTLPGKIARGMAVGGTSGYVAGLGEGEGDLAERHKYATSGDNALGVSPLEMGVVLGGAVPVAASGIASGARIAHDLASPTLARLGAQVRELPRKIGFPASADGAIPETPGAYAAAQQMIANQLARAGKTTEDLSGALDSAARARQMGTGSSAQDALALVDLDPALQRLAGSAGRANPEAANRMQAFHAARQTGVTPRNGLPADAGIPHRQPLAQPLTGEDARKQFGTTFGAPLSGEVPMGQGERILDGLKRALRIEDAASHGHAKNAYRTEEAIIDAARAEAKPAYTELYNQGANINIAPVLKPVLDKWQRGSAVLDREAEPVVQTIEKIKELFAPKGQPLTNIEKFDRTKQYLDRVIEKYFQGSESKNAHVGGLINEFKNDMLRAIDAVQVNGLGEKYATARSLYSSRMESKEALQRGRDAFKEGSDVGADAYRAIQGDGNKKLFRLGFFGAVEDRVKSMKRQDDKTLLFDNPRVQELLQTIIPRTETASGRAKGVYGDRPERFGAFIGDEKRMIETRNVTQGGSPTQRNIKDDEAYAAMSKLGETIERFKNSPNLTMLGVRAIEQSLQKLFGMNADVAASIARQLFTADPLVRAQVLNGVAQRLGKNRAEQLARLVQEYEGQASQIIARQGAAPREKE